MLLLYWKKLTESVEDGFSIRYYFFVYFECVLVSFDFSLLGNVFFIVLQNEVVFLMFSSSRFLLYFRLVLFIRLLTLFL